MSVPEVVQTSAGLLIGVAIAAGAVSAGVGAAVVGAVGALSSILDSAGLFGDKNPSATCPSNPGVKVSPPPDGWIGCVPRYGPPVPNASIVLASGKPKPNPYWKFFPDPNNPDD